MDPLRIRLLTRLPLLLFLLLPLAVQAQILKPAQWTSSVEPPEPKAGQKADLVFRVKLDEGWHVYGPENEVALPLTVEVAPNTAVRTEGKLKAPGIKHDRDEVLDGPVTYFEHSGEFRQGFIATASTKLDVTLNGQSCTDGGRCVPFSEDFSFQITVTDGGKVDGKSVPSTRKTEKAEAAAATVDSASATALAAIDTPATTATTELPGDSCKGALLNAQDAAGTDGGSLWAFFLLAFGGGLIAVLTPCVYPMMPMTVSFFLRSSGSRRRGVMMALFYGFSIIVLYLIIGVLFSRLNGPEFANFMSTHWLPGTLFFLIFVVFGFSFLGYFEILLPSSWGNAADAKAEKGGLLGVFFMALTLVIISFSCTGPIASSILVQSSGGVVIKPVVGMLGYSLAFALPFGLFAIFPQWLSNLPKSGGWMNTMKAVLGFLELALALKFLSLPDQAYHWHILDREIYLALWIVIFLLLGVYLLGKLRLPHDGDMAYVSWPRLTLAILSFTFVAYLVPGMFGAPLKALAGYMPPSTTQDFDLSRSMPGGGSTALCDEPKYGNLLHLPHGLQGYFDYKQALACAKASGKPVFIDFTGHACVNCREMEARVWSDPRILSLLREKFIVTALYVDDKTEVPMSEWYTSSYDGKVKKSIGKQNADFQITRFNANAQPFYVIVDSKGCLLAGPVTYDLDVDRFEAFLRSALRP